MKTTQQHLDALLAVEADSQFDSIPESVRRLRKKQNINSQTQKSKFEWIKTARDLAKSERNLTDQIERMQNDLGLLPSPRCGEQPGIDVATLVFNQNMSRDMNGSDDILDRKQRLVTIEKDLQKQCADLEAEIKVQRHQALQLVSDLDKQCSIPPTLMTALNCLSAIDEDGEVELLKQELLKEMETSNNKPDKLRRIELIKKKGLKRVECLQERIINKSMQTETNARDAKRQEMDAQLRLLQLQKELNDEDTLKHAHASCPESKVLQSKVVGIQRQLKSMQALSNHQLERVVDHEKDSTIQLEEEIIKQRNMSLNEERTSFREQQRVQNLISRQAVMQEKEREQQIRLARLDTIAASCPYQKKIADITADVHKTTNARHHDFYRKQNLPDFQLGRQTSFSNERMFSDPKFRLSNELHKAGIAQTIAARDVVRNAIPRTEARTTGIKPF